MAPLKTLATSAAIAGGLAFALPMSASAALIDSSPATVGAFCAPEGNVAGAAPNSYRASATSRYVYTCYNGAASQTLDPAVQAGQSFSVTDLAAATAVNIDEFTFGGEVTGTLQLTTFQGTPVTGTISYFVELRPSPGYTVTDQPAIRFSEVTLSQETLPQNAANTGTRKQITGQNNAVVDDASFTADITASSAGPGSANCGVCRKFAVTDSFNNDIDGVGGTGAGRIQSMTNTYITLEEAEVPVPAPLALIAIGMLGLGAATRRRKG
jgi:hypothetical protein